jgi:putative ABC transport system permease protein
VDGLLQDLRTALRSLRRSPALAAAAIVVLALGVGASAAIFAFVDKMLLRPFPFPADRLAQATEVTAASDRNEISAGLFEDWRAQSRAFDRLSAYRWWNTNVTGVNEPQHLIGYQVSPDLFATVGVQAELGRTLEEGEDQHGRAHVVVLSHELWQRQYGGDVAVLGRTAVLEGESYEIVGVMPAQFQFPKAASLWVPLVVTQQMRERRATHELLAVGRLRPGATLAEAQRELSRITEHAQAQHPGQDPGHGAHVLPLRDYLEPQARITLQVLFAAVGLLLLIACSSVALLLIVRSAARSREIAIRAALGATRARVVRQLLTESLLLAAGACGLGLVFAWWGIDALRAGMPASIARFVPGWSRVSLDRTLFSFAAIAAVLSAVVAGLLPSLKTSRLDLQQTLQAATRAASSGRGRGRLRFLLVTAQVALAVVLVVDAGLLLRTLRNLLATSPGFDVERVLTLRVGVAQAHREDAEVIRYYDTALARIRAIPGVERAGAVSRLPLSGSSADLSFTVEGAGLPAEKRPATLYQIATDGYFEAMGIPILSGRSFGAEDRAGLDTVIVSQSLARRYLQGQAVGQRIRLGTRGPWRTVVGVVGSVRHRDLGTDAGIAAYVPQAQYAEREMAFVVRTRSSPAGLGPAVRAALFDLDPAQPVSDLAPYRTVLDDNAFLAPRYAAGVLGIFALIALALSTVGVYGVMAVSVNQRQQEMGIRMALGAQRGDVLRLVLAQGLRPALAGIACGAALALASGRALEGVLVGVSGRDPATLLGVCSFLLAVAAAAALLPARRATRADPAAALRAE